MPFTPQRELTKTWREGFIWLKARSYNSNPAAYLSKYLTKGIGDPRFEGMKRYHCSKNLYKPVLSRDPVEIAGWIEGSQKTFEDSYKNEYFDNLKYSVYRKIGDSVVSGES
jgi:hypothetical protein